MNMIRSMSSSKTRSPNIPPVPKVEEVVQLQDHSTDQHEHEQVDQIMKIYLKLGLGQSALKLPWDRTRSEIRQKQRSWFRSELNKIPVVPKNGIQDLRVVMKNCRYLRFPKDMKDHADDN